MSDDTEYAKTLARRRRYLIRYLRDVQSALFRARLRALHAISDEQWAEAQAEGNAEKSVQQEV